MINKLLGVFAGIFILSVFGVFMQNSVITGYLTSGSAVSNVTIENYLAITMSDNFQTGILFGSVSALPATDINASHNYDGGSSASTMFINVSTDSNTPVDFCVKANAALTSSGLDVIGLGNETYNNATTTSATVPSVSTQTGLTTDYVKSGVNIAQGNSNYYRFWLDVPVATSAATYNNTIMFLGVVTGSACA